MANSNSLEKDVAIPPSTLPSDQRASTCQSVTRGRHLIFRHHHPSLTASASSRWVISLTKLSCHWACAQIIIHDTQGSLFRFIDQERAGLKQSLPSAFLIDCNGSMLFGLPVAPPQARCANHEANAPNHALLDLHFSR